MRGWFHHPKWKNNVELLAVLQPLPPADWSRAATVTGAGKPHERTSQSYAQWLANHERSHFRQFKNIARAIQTWH